MKKPNRVVKNGSPRAPVLQVQKHSRPARRAADRVRRLTAAAIPVTFRIQVKDPKQVIEVELDDCQSEDFWGVVKSTRLTAKELFHSIFFRQMESFQPEDPCYSVFRDARKEVSASLDEAETSGIAIEVIARSMLKRLEESESKSAVLAQLSAWTELIREMATGIRISAADGNCHWENGIVPALLERKVAPGAQAAA